MTTDRLTPLADEHRRLGARTGPFGGWLMPIQYPDGIIAEHHWTRRSAGVFDTCHMGMFAITGDAETTGLEYALTCPVGSLPVGGCRYGFLLNDAGGIADDVVVMRLGDEDWIVVVNAATATRDEQHLRAIMRRPEAVRSIAAETGKLDLQGPLSREVLRPFLPPGILETLGYYRTVRTRMADMDVIVSRTGYTGELGYELFVPRDRVVTVWGTLLHDERVKPAGLGARDTLRLEMGYPLYGQDITADTTPFEAGLERFVDLRKFFHGKSALIEQWASGIKRRLVGCRTDSRRSPRHGHRILAGGRVVGSVTSGSFSPSLGCGIALGYVETAYAEPGIGVVITDGGMELPAIVTEPPFYRDGTARTGG